MLASSVQATLNGRYADGEYGKSKKAGEKLFFEHASETGSKLLVYRFCELREHGKTSRENYPKRITHHSRIGVLFRLMLQSFRRADFVFHLAGVNRSKDSSEFMQGFT